MVTKNKLKNRRKSISSFQTFKEYGIVYDNGLPWYILVIIKYFRKQSNKQTDRKIEEIGIKFFVMLLLTWLLTNSYTISLVHGVYYSGKQ